MEEIELRSLILKGEDSSLQFKEQVTSCEKLAREIVAFMNMRGGHILIGIADDGSLKPLSTVEVGKLNQLISNTTKDHIQPPVTVETENVVVGSGVVVALHIEEGIDKPYQTKAGGEFWIKSGADKRHVTNRDELRRLFQIGSHVYAEKQVIRGTALNQIDFKQYRKFLELTHQTDAPEDEEILISQMRALHLINGSELTLAGCLLFAKSPEHIVPQFSVKVAWIKGTDITSSEYKDQRQFDGSIVALYTKTYEFLDAWNQRRQPIGGSYNSNGESIIPPAVFEEILTNAFIHRDYFVPDSIKVFIFDNRIEIYSPGTLPNSLTVEEALLAGITRKRNPIIEQIGLTLMDYRGHGSGLPRAKHLYPSIRFDNDTAKNAFIVTLPF